MTSDRLDEQAEARIREACPRHKIRTISNTIASEDFDLLAYPCTCPVQRAAILADREARPFRAEHRPQCTKHRCDLTSTITESWYCAVCEAGRADALAKALRELDAVARGPLHWGQRGVKIRVAKRAAKAVLAAHDKLRGR